MLFNIDASFSDFGYGEDGDTLVRDPWSYRCSVWFIITRPMNNAHIYASIQPSLQSFDFAKGEVMELVSTHNSCWQDGIKQVLRDAEYIGIKEFYSLENHVAWNQMHDHVGFSCFQKPGFIFLKEPIQVEGDTSAPHGFWKLEVERKYTTMQDVVPFLSDKPDNYIAWR